MNPLRSDRNLIVRAVFLRVCWCGTCKHDRNRGESRTFPAVFLIRVQRGWGSLRRSCWSESLRAILIQPRAASLSSPLPYMSRALGQQKERVDSEWTPARHPPFTWWILKLWCLRCDTGTSVRQLRIDVGGSALSWPLGPVRSLENPLNSPQEWMIYNWGAHEWQQLHRRARRRCAAPRPHVYACKAIEVCVCTVTSLGIPLCSRL